MYIKLNELYILRRYFKCFKCTKFKMKFNFKFNLLSIVLYFFHRKCNINENKRKK